MIDSFDVYVPVRMRNKYGNWEIFLDWIDTIFATVDTFTEEEMRMSLIHHDGYRSNIVVEKR